MRKNIVFAILLLSLVLPISVSAHSGGTDSKGGHYNRSTGEYHYHHGHPAHQHENGICPYDFDDKTGENSGTSSGSGTKTTVAVSTPTPTPSPTPTKKVTIKPPQKPTTEERKSGHDMEALLLGLVITIITIIGIPVMAGFVYFVAEKIIEKRNKKPKKESEQNQTIRTQNETVHKSMAFQTVKVKSQLDRMIDYYEREQARAKARARWKTNPKPNPNPPTSNRENVRKSKAFQTLETGKSRKTDEGGKK